MPYEPNANWIVAVQSNTQKPIYVLQIEGLTAWDYSTGHVVNPTRPIKPYLKMPTSIGQSLRQDVGDTQMAVSSFKIIDRNDDFTALIGNRGLTPTPITGPLDNRRLTLLQGFAGLDGADFAPVMIARVESVFLENDGLTWNIKTVDAQRIQNESIYRNADVTGSTPIDTTLYAPFASGESEIYVVDRSRIRDGDILMIGPATVGNLGAEVVVEVAKDGIPDAISPPWINRVILTERQFGEQFYGAPDATGDRVRWASSVIEGNPINIILATLTGDFSNALYPLMKAYGLPIGAGVLASDIDVQSFITERDLMYDGWLWRIEVTKKETARQFLQRMFYKWLGFMYSANDGRLSFKAWRPERPEAIARESGFTTASRVLTESDFKSWSLEILNKYHRNRFVVGVDYDFERKKASAPFILEDTNDQAQVEAILETEEQETPIRQGLGGDEHAEMIAHNLARRYGRSPVQINGDMLTKHRDLQMGETVLITHSKFPDLKSGARGVTLKRYEITDRQEQFSGDKLMLKFQEDPFVRPAFIAPDSHPSDYELGTTEEKVYAAIGEDLDEVQVYARFNFAPSSDPGTVAGFYQFTENTIWPTLNLGVGLVTAGWVGGLPNFTHYDNANAPDAAYDSNASAPPTESRFLVIQLPFVNANSIWECRAVAGSPPFGWSQQRLVVNGVVFWENASTGGPNQYLDVIEEIPVDPDTRLIVVEIGPSATTSSLLNWLALREMDPQGLFADGGSAYEII